MWQWEGLAGGGWRCFMEGRGEGTSCPWGREDTTPRRCTEGWGWVIRVWAGGEDEEGGLPRVTGVVEASLGAERASRVAREEALPRHEGAGTWAFPTGISPTSNSLRRKWPPGLGPTDRRPRRLRPPWPPTNMMSCHPYPLLGKALSRRAVLRPRREHLQPSLLPPPPIALLQSRTRPRL